MTRLLWQKTSPALDEAVQRYLAADDVALDRHLFPHDIEATIAHVRGLVSIEALPADDGDALIDALNDLAGRFERGEFILDDRFEDGHTAIEAFLTDRLGEIGRKVHLGRSRNDQVLVAQRLYVKTALAGIRAHTIAAARQTLDLAEADRDTLMPGYTHLQRAVPSTIGLWMASFAEAFIDDAALLDMTTRWLDASPLGTAAGYGVNLPLPREQTAAALGFERLLINPMYAQATRGTFEVQALSACWQVMQEVRRLAWDLSMFSTTEFGFVRMADAVSTGSSIMPNKRNPDLVELMRAGAAVVAGCMTELQQLLALPSGYHRDLQLTKAPIVRALTHTARTVELVPLLLDSIEFDREVMKRAIDPTMLATDRAVDLAVTGLPFRDAYRQVAEELASGTLPSANTLEQSVASRTSPGACADLRLDGMRARLDALADGP
jgi:argininosuccinate lyase